ncbi:unnamed protein product [Adineta ricciae]|uniref:ADP ribosyltransferase domain-containing protein n=1 Tax=Adineta ricciae TaxID=249248 RepID=A0A813NPL0_ADIRI|nr:unnamed protein product [Adineta ricciae]CAF1019922.1 unnamed protein product [Adineta ricciae]
MTTTTAFSSRNLSAKADLHKQLESYCLVWLDASVHENAEIEDKLRCVIDQLEKFDNAKECQEYIEQRSRTDRIILIVSGQFGKQLIPIIHKLRQVLSVYVYCIDQTNHEQWANQYSKIKGVFTKLCDLLSRIASDHNIQKKIEDPLPICIFNFDTNVDQSITIGNDQFVFIQTYLDLLLRLNSNENDRIELINRLRKQFKDNPTELNHIFEFEQSYSPDQALQWYTKKTFFYKTLNAALRHENLHMIFLYRSYILDIYRQLEDNQVQHILKVYRGQMITKHELEILRKSIDQFICVNSFFSTSRLYNEAFAFLRSSTNLERVMFEIEADPMRDGIKVFADIRKYSVYAKEAEVLFMIGSVFRVKSVIRNHEDNKWLIKLNLSNEEEYDPKGIYKKMKQKNSKGEIDLRTVAQFLLKNGKVDLAKKYFIRSINEASIDDPQCADLYDDLSRLASKACDYDKSFQYLRKSIKCKQQTNASTAGKSLKSTKQLKWKPNGINITGESKVGVALSHPFGIFVTKLKSVYIADWGNDRIVRWKCGSTLGEIVVAGNGFGNRLDQLSNVTDLVVDEKTSSYIICDRGNKRVVRWFDRSETNQQIVLNNIACYGICMDSKGFIYVSDTEKHEVKRWKEGEKEGIVVAGGNEKGNELKQLNCPTFVFVDDDASLYISDRDNHRVVKWVQDASEGIVVAGGNDCGKDLKQLCFPEGIVVDALGHVYVSDYGNNRVVRWCEGDKNGSIIVNGTGVERDANQFYHPSGLSLDNENNLYVVDQFNNRVQKYELDLEDICTTN